MPSSSKHEHVITMRRPSPGIQWLVTHLESMAPAAGDDDARAGRLQAGRVQTELAGQLVLSVLDPQAADSPPPGRDPDQQLGLEADLWEGPGVQEAGPGQQPVQYG